MQATTHELHGTIATIEQFSAAIVAAGLTPPESIEADGRRHRFASNGARGDDAGWYYLNVDGVPCGAFGCWRAGFRRDWRLDLGRGYSSEERNELAGRLKEIRAQQRRESEERNREAALRASEMLRSAIPAAADHPYLKRKQIKAHGVQQIGDWLAVPMREGQSIRSIQFINPDGQKHFLTGGQMLGCSYMIGGAQGASTIYVAEGFATAATIHEATGSPIAIAFCATNLRNVAQAIRHEWPETRLIVCGDDDWRTSGNPGKAKATAAARAVGAAVAFPQFAGERAENATDFNDLALAEGLDRVRACLSRPSSIVACESWPEAQPLLAKIPPQPYPIDALPPRIRSAVEEVQRVMQAPLPLVACSALGVVSTSLQGLAKVRRAEGIEGPPSLYLLVVADSGERKTACDGRFTTQLLDSSREAERDAAPELARYRAESAAWGAKRDGMLQAIKQSAAGKRSRGVLDDHALREHEAAQPVAPRVPRWMLGDETPESLAWRLAKEWPSSGVISAEAGIVFGSHGMSRDTVMRNLSQLNVYWDGGELSFGRRTSESFCVRGVRLTLALQVQTATINAFIDSAKGLPRGTGFLARFLVAFPESTQGTRMFVEPPRHWPNLTRFNQRVAELLSTPLPINDRGELDPPVYALGPDARPAWVRFHDEIEALLGSGGELFDIRDAAAKAADNAARLSFLFDAFESGLGGAVGLDAMLGACRVVAWHLQETRRFFGELSLPQDLADASSLDKWLLDYCRREGVEGASLRTVAQLGPNHLRNKGAIETTAKGLQELDRLRIEKPNRSLFLRVNPALLSETRACA